MCSYYGQYRLYTRQLQKNRPDTRSMTMNKSMTQKRQRYHGYVMK